jgi:hypothetical protein
MRLHNVGRDVEGSAQKDAFSHENFNGLEVRVCR